MTAATNALPGERATTTLLPWGEHAVKHTLERWWELRSSPFASTVYLGNVKRAREERVARDFTATVAFWVWATHGGMKRLFPERAFGRDPLVVSWLIVLNVARESMAKASEAQRAALTEGRLKDDLTREKLDAMWRKANRASTLAHKIEHSRSFGIAIGFLAVAFSMCANEDWTWRGLEEVERG